MKKILGLTLLTATILLQGCIALPPLIQVEHKDAPAKSQNDEILRKLDSIEQRLNQLEKSNGK